MATRDEKHTSPLSVTFDTNTWQRIVLPERFPGDPRRQEFIQIKDAIANGNISAFICDSVATLEGVSRKDRADFLRQREVVPKLFSYELGGETITAVTMAPDESGRPPLSEILLERIEQAARLGMKLMRPARFHDLILDRKYYAPEPEEFADVYHEVSAAIENRGVGRAFLRQIGREMSTRLTGPAVYTDIPNVPLIASDNSRISNAVAEWADAETMSCHIAFGNDVFCTEDKGNTAGAASILDARNREWLAVDYDVRILDIVAVASEARYLASS